MNFAAFPQTFPADAASKIGQAILNKQFTKDLVEPIYDLIGFGLFKLFGSSDTPTPTPPVPKTFADGIHDDADHEAVAHLLNAAADAHRNRMTTAGGVTAAPNVAALPWGTIISVLITILQGLLLGVSPSPIPNPVPTPTPAPE